MSLLQPLLGGYRFTPWGRGEGQGITPILTQHASGGVYYDGCSGDGPTQKATSWAARYIMESHGLPAPDEEQGKIVEIYRELGGVIRKGRRAQSIEKRKGKGREYPARTALAFRTAPFLRAHTAGSRYKR